MPEHIDYVINFDFEEVNAAVFRNAQIYLRKKTAGGRTCVIVPSQFMRLFKDADCLAVMEKDLLRRFGIAEYRDVLNYNGFGPGAGVWARRLDALRRRGESWLMRAAAVLGEAAGARVYSALYRSLRQRRFYVDSGLETYCLQKLKDSLGGFRYLRVGDYFDFSRMKVWKMDLSAHFGRNFSYLYSMIRDRALYTAPDSAEAVRAALGEAGSGLNPEHLPWLRNFAAHKGFKFVLRTRNFRSKAVTHNSSPATFRGLAEALLARGALVLNLGCPLLELGLRAPGYLEIDHNLPFETELALCRNADAAAMTGGAGLFTAFAAADIRVIQLDDEWSELLTPPIKLMEARAAAGLADIDIRPFVAAGDYAGAAAALCAAPARAPLSLVTTGPQELIRLD